MVQCLLAHGVLSDQARDLTVERGHPDAARGEDLNHGVGVWNQPHLLDHVAGRPAPRVGRRRVVSATVAAQINAMFQNVVVEGTGTLAAVPGYKVAGKTGTAAKPDPRGGYSDSRYVA